MTVVLAAVSSECHQIMKVRQVFLVIFLRD